MGGDFFFSFFLFFKVKWFLIREANEVRRHFPGFIPYEKAFKRTYRFCNPFRICRQFLQQRGLKLIDAYGETPLPVFAQIAKECSLSQGDTVIEMGCGRGRGVFFLSYLLSCRVIGIDWVPFFIEKANLILNSCSPRLFASFQCKEMSSVDFSVASVIYLYGTCLSDEEICLLVGRFELLPSSVKIITVSYPLSSYSPKFRIIKQFTAYFPWGKADVYWNARE